MKFQRVIDDDGLALKGDAAGALRARCAECHVKLPTPASDCIEHPLAGRDITVILAARLTEAEAATVEAQMLAQLWDIPAEPAGDDPPSRGRPVDPAA